MKTTGLFTVGTRDAIKGLFVSMITVVFSMVYSMLNAGTFPMTFEAWKPILLAGAGAGMAYIMKNFLTNSNDQILTKEQPKN